MGETRTRLTSNMFLLSSLFALVTISTVYELMLVDVRFFYNFYSEMQISAVYATLRTVASAIPASFKYAILVSTAIAYFGALIYYSSQESLIREKNRDKVVFFKRLFSMLHFVGPLVLVVLISVGFSVGIVVAAMVGTIMWKIIEGLPEVIVKSSRFWTMIFFFGIVVVGVAEVLLFPHLGNAVRELVFFATLVFSIKLLDKGTRDYYKAVTEDYELVENLWDIGEEIEEWRKDIKEMYEDEPELAFAEFREMGSRFIFHILRLPTSLFGSSLILLCGYLLMVALNYDFTVFSVLYVLMALPIALQRVELLKREPKGPYEIVMEKDTIDKAYILSERYDKGYINVLTQNGQKRVMVRRVISLEPL